jgi:signal transduction histidine kinase
MGYRSGVRDITEREQAEESLRKANELQRVEADVLATQEKLLKEQRRGKRRLQKLNRELGRRNRELQDFVQVVSHDLRAPLVNIRGFGDLLASACDRARTAIAGSQDEASLRAELLPLLGEEIPESLGFIRVGSSKMDSLLTGLLNISRIGIAALNIEQLDMNQLVAEIFKSLAFSIEKAGASVQIDALPPCRGDAIQLGQVFSNLLDNALKHLDASRTGVIRVSAHKRRKDVVYCVEDNGIGIEAKQQEAVFGLFHRIHPDRGDGLGLGLAIVRRAIDRQDGKVWLESTPNQGSKFFVSLPSGLGLSP